MSWDQDSPIDASQSPIVSSSGRPTSSSCSATTRSVVGRRRRRPTLRGEPTDARRRRPRSAGRRPGAWRWLRSRPRPEPTPGSTAPSPRLLGALSFGDGDRRSDRYGAQSMTAPLRDVLVKRPGAGVRRGVRRPRPRLPPSGRPRRRPARARRLRRDPRLARARGSTSSTTRPTARISSTPFDPLLVTDRGAIPLRPGKPNRPSEPATLEAWTTAPGIPTLGRIEAPGTIEGGDTFWLRPDLLCIGRTLRTNDDGARQLAELVGGDVRIFDLPYWHGPAELIHLLSVDLAGRRRPGRRLPAAAAGRALELLAGARASG